MKSRRGNVPAKVIAHRNNYISTHTSSISHLTKSDHTYIMLNYLKNVSDLEVLCWFQFAVLATPRYRFSLLSIWFELEQRVINTIKEHLIVDMLALSQEVAEDFLPRWLSRCL